jgi:TPP-dependent trihydroxycyclohexane-1,2-dione (THcHDO) dehydratase
VELRTQHLGWYLAVASCVITAVSGLFALVFGRGNVMGRGAGLRA